MVIINDIYKMKLHDQFYSKDFIVLRVPGGWIYTQLDDDEYNKHFVMTSTFVPFNNEFQHHKEFNDGSK